MNNFIQLQSNFTGNIQTASDHKIYIYVVPDNTFFMVETATPEKYDAFDAI